MAILYLPVFLILKKRGRGAMRQSSYLLCFWSCFIIIFATILFDWPIVWFGYYRFLNLVPFAWLWEPNVIRRLITEIILNILMFVPFGVFVPVVFKTFRKLYMIALLGFLFSFAIEFTQYFIGRTADIDDLIGNLTGAVLGYGIFVVFGRLFKYRRWWKGFIGIA
jgi:glycopeptide antibiotics resistance protein